MKERSAVDVLRHIDHEKLWICDLPGPEKHDDNKIPSNPQAKPGLTAEELAAAWAQAVRTRFVLN
jgi:hypothetical protein